MVCESSIQEKMKTVCDLNACTGCAACVCICKKEAIRIVDRIEFLNAEIDSSKCVNCGLCKTVCPVCSQQEQKKPIYWKQGWANNSFIRRSSSSGGVASAIIHAFIKSGGYVASCVFETGEFRFIVTNDIETAKGFSGSKYVKSNPIGIYKEVEALLNKGEKVLFLGLPCQSAAIQHYCNSNEKLYTVDLICHGTPSPYILKSYLEEKGIYLNMIKDISFRQKGCLDKEKNGKRLLPYGIIDGYMLAFLKGLDYTDNCYSCIYANEKRVSDITLGDAWGQLSDLDNKGVSLILCQSNKGILLVKESDICLRDVDILKAIKSNQQLHHPTTRHKGRNKFMSALKHGSSIRIALLYAMTRECIIIALKSFLVKIHLLKETENSVNFGIIVF